MAKKRRAISADLKFKIVLEALKGQRQISEIASEFEVHPPGEFYFQLHEEISLAFTPGSSTTVYFTQPESPYDD